MSRPATSTRATSGTPLTRSALPVLQNLLGEGLEDWPASVILTGAGGVVLCRLTAGHDLGAAP
jgi:hypothetical protein